MYEKELKINYIRSKRTVHRAKLSVKIIKTVFLYLTSQFHLRLHHNKMQVIPGRQRLVHYSHCS